MLIVGEHDIYINFSSTATSISLELTLRGKVEMMLKAAGNQLHTQTSLCTTDKNTSHANIIIIKLNDTTQQNKTLLILGSNNGSNNDNNYITKYKNK